MQKTVVKFVLLLAVDVGLQWNQSSVFIDTTPLSIEALERPVRFVEHLLRPKYRLGYPSAAAADASASGNSICTSYPIWHDSLCWAFRNGAQLKSPGGDIEYLYTILTQNYEKIFGSFYIHLVSRSCTRSSLIIIVLNFVTAYYQQMPLYRAEQNCANLVSLILFIEILIIFRLFTLYQYICYYEYSHSIIMKPDVTWKKACVWL